MSHITSTQSSPGDQPYIVAAPRVWLCQFKLGFHHCLDLSVPDTISKNWKTDWISDHFVASGNPPSRNHRTIPTDKRKARAVFACFQAGQRAS